jgi:hypothetical protein
MAEERKIMDGKLKRPPGKPTFNWNTVLWTLLMWMAAIYLFQMFSTGSKPNTLAYTKFKEMVRQGKVIDAEIKKITLGMEEKARAVLESNRNQLDALAAALLEHETLTRAEIDGIVKGTQTAN